MLTYACRHKSPNSTKKVQIRFENPAGRDGAEKKKREHRFSTKRKVPIDEISHQELIRTVSAFTAKFFFYRQFNNHCGKKLY
jgi:hypothetical protein